MALSFTDAQLRELTGQVVNSATKIQALNDEKVSIAKIKTDYKDLDDQEAIFTNHWVNSINRFHNELLYINSTQKTAYQVSSIEPSAQLLPTSIHFPTGYPNFKPKLDASNTGLPITTSTNPNEDINLDKCIEWSNRIKNGFTGSNISGTGIYTAGAIAITIGSPVGTIAVGSDIVAFKNNAAIWGKVTGFTSTTTGGPPSADPLVTTQQITINVLNTYGSLSGVVDWALFHVGFTDATRTSTSVNGFLLLCKESVDIYKNNIKQYINSQLTELNANDSKADKSEIDTAKNTNNTAIANFDSWFTKPLQTRFSDTNLALLTTYLNSRKSYLPTRVSQINTSLGSVNQVANGDFSGSGRYLDLFNSVMLRVHKATGHLRNFYQQNLIGQSIDERIYVATTQANRDKDLVTVKLFKEEPTNTQMVELVDVSKLSVNDSIAIMDNEYVTINRYTVVEIIQPNKVKLSDVVPTSYKLEFQVRLVKMT